jgi:hypothetical protein
VKKRKLLPWPKKKKDSAKKHQHPEGPSQVVFDLACEILAVLYENGGTMDLHDVADELLGPDGYVGAGAEAFDDAYGYLRGYGALEVVTYCEHEKPALVRAKTMTPLVPLVGPDKVVRTLICIKCGLANYTPVYDDDLPDVIVAFEARRDAHAPA